MTNQAVILLQAGFSNDTVTLVYENYRIHVLALNPIPTDE